jgi:homopolymeric O-antigen transport system permease protein
MWDGDYGFVLQSLVLKDFKVRYRNMSLGFFWSLLNPLVMMGVLTLVFTRIFPNPSSESFPLFVLCGLIPFNFFSLAWSSATTSLLENAPLVKKVLAPREIVPIASVLSNCIHLGIQLALLLVLVLAAGKPPSRQWLWLPVVFGFEIAFVCGLGLVSSALDLYVRDTRYVVDSTITVLFWLVPIFYSLSFVPDSLREIYQWNPIAAAILSLREI